MTNWLSFRCVRIVTNVRCTLQCLINDKAQLITAIWPIFYVSDSSLPGSSWLSRPSHIINEVLFEMYRMCECELAMSRLSKVIICQMHVHAVLSVLWHCWLGHLTCKNPSPIWLIMCLVGR